MDAEAVADAIPDAIPAPPSIVGVTPPDLAVGASPQATIEVQFATAMDPASIDASSFEITRDGATVAGAFTYDQDTHTTIFRATGGLALLGRHQARITTAAVDVHGTPLSEERTWSFVVRDGQWETAEIISPTNVGAIIDIPKVAADAMGNAIAVWYQPNATANDIWTSRFTPESGWDEPSLLETEAGSAQAPRIEMTPSGDAVVVWIQNDGSTWNTWSRTFSLTSGWGPPTPVESDALTTDLAVAATGDAFIVFNRGADAWAARMIDGAWQAAAQIESHAEVTQYPRITLAESGHAVAIWQHANDAGVWSNTFVPSLGWGTATRRDNATNQATFPELAGTPTGDAIVVWHQLRTGGFDIWADRYVLGAGWLGASAIEVALADARRPQIAMQASGEAVAVWTQGGDVYAGRFAPPSGWGQSVRLETTTDASDYQYVVVDGAGNAVAAWQQWDVGGRADVWASRFINGIGWGPATHLETNDTGDAHVPLLAIHASGVVSAVWRQSDGTTWDIWSTSFR